MFLKRDRGLSKTFDIEHLFRKHYDLTALPTTHGFIDSKDYSDQRDFLGALILLPRAKNRSLQDKPYKDKVAIYAADNVLAQTLHPSFYKNSPEVTRFITANPCVGLTAVPDFDKSSISSRAATYTALANLIWATP